MKLRTTILLGSCAILLLGLRATAQDIGVPAVGGAAAAPAAPAGPNLFTMLLPPPEMRERCRQKLCKCEIVKLLRSSMMPASAMTGGIIPVGNCCPTIKKEDLLKPADSAEGAAARIMKDAEEAKARREAVRILGTVDCRYWPEAEDGLINALRADKIECVRWEAAMQLQRGCCCTKKIAKALTICIEGSDKDGHPAERSCRVQEAAALALSMCVFEDKVEPKDVKDPEKKKLGRVDPKDYYRNVETANESVFDGARKALEKRGPVTSTQVLSNPHRAGSQGLFGIMGHAFESSNDPATETSREPQPMIAATPQTQQNQPPQRRGLLYKILPGEEQASYSPPIQAPTTFTPPPVKNLPVTPATKPQPVTTVHPIAPTPAKAQPMTNAQPSFPSSTAFQQQPLPAGDVRPASFVPYRGPSTTDEPFSTAAPATSAAPRPMTPTATPRPEQGQPGFISTPPGQLGLVPVETSSAPTRPAQGQPGFVLFNEDAPARR